jgi:hypothetical protein
MGLSPNEYSRIDSGVLLANLLIVVVTAVDGLTLLSQPAPASGTEKSGDRTDNTGRAQAANQALSRPHFEVLRF